MNARMTGSLALLAACGFAWMALSAWAEPPRSCPADRPCPAACTAATETQVALEFRIITASDDHFERVGVDFNAPCGEAARCLTDKQVHFLLEAAQGDRRTNVLQAPKVTLLDGQTGTVNLPGLRLTARPNVSADRHSVRVFVKVDATESPDGGKTAVGSLESTVAVPDGGTIVLGGLKTVAENGPPILSKVPHVNRLFKNVAPAGQQSVQVLVTPRIVCCAPDEKVATHAVSTTAATSARSADAPRQDRMVAELLRACEASCAEGRDAEAGRYLRAALAIDPTCLRRPADAASKAR